jgi:hypothetical protein
MPAYRDSEWEVSLRVSVNSNRYSVPFAPDRARVEKSPRTGQPVAGGAPRPGDAAVMALDDLVEAGLFGSRSEGAVLVLGVGVEAQHELFDCVGKHSAEIKGIRQSLKRDALVALRGAAARSRRLSSPGKSREG